MLGAETQGKHNNNVFLRANTFIAYMLVSISYQFSTIDFNVNFDQTFKTY